MSLLLGSGEGEEEQEHGPLFSGGYVLAVLHPPCRQHGIGPLEATDEPI